MNTLALCIGLLCIHQPTDAVDARNDDPEGIVGEVPYEMVGREPAHEVLVDFEDLTGWTTVGVNGAHAEAFRSREQRLFGEHVAKVVYSGGDGQSFFELRPSAPIPIPGSFTGVNLWVYGNNWWWLEPPETVRTRVSVVFRDASGQEWESEVGLVNFFYWHLFHATVIGPRGQLSQALGTGEEIAFPCEFTAIRVRDCTDPRPQKLFFDALQFYTIEVPPLEFEAAPDDHLWPTDPGATAPPVPEPSAQPRATGSGSLRLPLNPMLTAVYEPRTGALADLSYVTKDRRRITPCADGGIILEIGGSAYRTADAAPRLVGWGMETGWYAYVWRATVGGVEVTWTIRLRREGGSIAVELDCPGGVARELDLGYAEGVGEARPIEVPYWTYSMYRDGSVLRADLDGGLFLSGWFDWHVSNGSEIIPPAPTPIGGDGYRYLPRVRYRPKTDGRCNDLHERIVLCASPRFEDTLPNLPYAPTDAGEAGRRNTWRNIGFMAPEMLQEYKRRGIDHFTACHHEVIWRDGGESFTLRLQSAPKNVGDERLQEYSELVRGLGYNFGLYTNYTDYAPVNQYWDEDAVALDPDGRWIGAWPRCYAPKPALAPEREAWFAPRINAKFRTTASYCDVATAIAPWERTDYDARVPGAGTYRAVWEAYARCMHQETANHAGPAFSEGLYLWMYAGLSDGNYAQITQPTPWLRPPLVDFDLRRIHPLETDVGMGRPSHYFQGFADWFADTRRTSPMLDRFLCATIAFGHIGYLTQEWGMGGTLKSYFLIQPLQERYALVPVAEIRYQSDEGLVDTSQALALRAVEERRQVYARYANGLETWCNLSFDLDWEVETPAGALLLPPTGWAAVLAGDIVAYSAIVDGHRVDYLQTPEVVYLDTRGEHLRAGPVRARGAVALKRDASGWTVIPATEAERVEIDFAALGAPIPATPTAEGMLSDGTAVRVADGLDGRRVLRTADGVYLSDVSDLAQCRLAFAEPAPGPMVTLTLPDADAPLLRGQTARALLRVENRSHGAWDGKVILTAEGLAWRETAVEFGSLEAGAHADAWMDLTPGDDAEEGDVALVRAAPASMPQAECALVAPMHDPVRLSFSLDSYESIAPPVEIPLHILAESRLTRDVTTEVRCAIGEETSVVPLTIPAGGRGAIELSVAIGAEDAAVPLTAETEVDGAVCSTTVWLWSSVSREPVVDLAALTPDVTERQRGQLERPITPESGAVFRTSSEMVGGAARPGFYVHPPYNGGVGYTAGQFELTLPEFPCQLRMHVGFIDGATTMDGCEFRVLVTGQDGEERLAASVTYAELRTWLPMEADLSDWSGETVRIKLAVDVGPADNSTCDWAAIGEPVIVPLEPVAMPRLVLSADDLPIAPPPQPLPGLTAADLETIEEAWLRFEEFGLQGPGPDGCEALVNGVSIGALRTSASGDAWGAMLEMPLSEEAIRSVGASNKLVIRNPHRDCFKVRRVWLRFRLADGRVGSTLVVNGPFCSDHLWAHREGAAAVPLGDDVVVGGIDVPRGP